MSMFQKKDQPGFNRHRWILDHHDRDLPAECLEVLKLTFNGYDNAEISALLGTTIDRVQMWIDYVVDMICGGWPASRPADTVAVFWFEDHRLCCTRDAFREMEYQFYPQAERWHFEQPARRLARREAGKRGNCRWRWPASLKEKRERHWVRHGCGRYEAIGMKCPYHDHNESNDGEEEAADGIDS